MKEMTEEEAAYWDDYYTKNPPKVDPAKNGGFAKKSFRVLATHKTPTEIIGELVREKVAAEV
jgi:hypothetical protein